MLSIKIVLKAYSQSYRRYVSQQLLVLKAYSQSYRRYVSQQLLNNIQKTVTNRNFIKPGPTDTQQDSPL